MTSKLPLPVRAVVALAVTGSMALAGTAWAQQVHQAEVAGAAGIGAQLKAGEGVYQTVCLAVTRPTARACRAPSHRSQAPITCSVTRSARSAWWCAVSRARSS